MSTAASARFLALVCGLQKDSVDVERLRAKLSKAYKKAYLAEARGAIAEAIEQLRGMGGEIDSEEAGELMSVMDRRLGSEGEGLAARLLNESVTVVRDVFTLSAGDGKGGGRYNLRLTDNRAIRIMREHDLIWMRGHYQDDLHGQFKTAVDDVMRTGYSRAKLATELSDRFGGVVDGDAQYWSDLADHTVTKAREIGRIAGFEEAGITEVRVRAVVDSRTSAMCRSLNGRIIKIEHLQAQRDSILSAKTKEELSAAAAWPNSKSYPAASFQGQTKDLPGNIGIPPFHYKCRTTLLAVVKPIKVNAVKGGRAAPRDAEMIDRFDAKEHALRVRDVRENVDSLEYEKKLFRGDVIKGGILEKHGGAFGIKLPTDEHGRPVVTDEDKARYLHAARKAIYNADDVVVRVHRPSETADPVLQYHYYTRGGVEVAVDQAGSIRMCDGFDSEFYDRRVENRSGDGLWLKNPLND